MKRELIMISAVAFLVIMILALPWAQKPAHIHNIEWVAPHDWTVEVTGTIHELEFGFRNDGTVHWRPGKPK